MRRRSEPEQRPLPRLRRALGQDGGDGNGLQQRELHGEGKRGVMKIVLYLFEGNKERILQLMRTCGRLFIAAILKAP